MIVRTLVVILAVFATLLGRCDEVMPPAPAHYFNDYAGVVSTGVAQQLNQTLENFERQTSSQILVAIYQKMQSDSSIEDYTVRVAQSWHVGQKGKDNGAVLFVFIDEHKMFIQVGYGLEGALSDALCKRIIQNEIMPRFRNQDFDGGMTAGVQAILLATQGEYKGTGRTVADRAFAHFNPVWIIFLFIVVLSVLRALTSAFSGPAAYSRTGYARRNSWIMWGGGGGWGGGSSGGGGGGFSGGGGSFGGGGAGGSW